MDTEHRYIQHKGAGRRSASGSTLGSTVHSCIFVENYSISIRVHVDVDVDVYNVDAVLREEKERGSCVGRGTIGTSRLFTVQIRVC